MKTRGGEVRAQLIIFLVDCLGEVRTESVGRVSREMPVAG